VEQSAAFGADAIVRIWEQGRTEGPVDRALTILGVLTERPRQELAAMSVERRDNMLLAWRSQLFGNTLSGYAACPGCGCGVDASVSAADPEPAGEPEERFFVEVRGTKVAVRLPTSLDLASVAGCENVEAASRALIHRCLEDDCAGGPGPDGDAVAAAVEAELDRRAGVSASAVTLACPDCGHGWDVELDIAAFAWREIEILAGRLLRHVDVLARRYGWSEREILQLSPARRRFYLELAS
jgi:hypothetical protein